MYKGIMRIFELLLLLAATVFARTDFWAPVTPPRGHYSVDVKFVSGDTPRLEGTETIRFRNETSRPIGRIALEWFGDVLRVRSGGVAAERAPGIGSPALFRLPREIEPGGHVELAVEYGASWKPDPATGSAVTSFLNPRLWWGFGTLDDYEVRLAVPEGYAVATSGRYDPAASVYKAQGIRAFGLFAGKGYEIAEADAGDVHVRAVFTKAGRPCAELLVKTAVDVIGFYRERFGLYPHRSLAIVPGMEYPAGGYPVATAMVVIHGEEQMGKKPEEHFRWITAHEIGHMYWGDYVLAQGADSLNWLMIGLGLHADREYRRARGIAGPVGNLAVNYMGGMRDGVDTTMDLTDEQEEMVEFDYNNIVEHGKSSAMMDALESTIGREAFDQAYKRALGEYHGRRMGAREFERLCEQECGEDLGWFFESWTRSNQYTLYRLGKPESARTAEGWRTEVEVASIGTRTARVPVAARFEDGTEQTQRTDRLAAETRLVFESKAALKEVILDPERTQWMPEGAPPPTAGELKRKISALSLTGSGEAALALMLRAREMHLTTSMPWRRLGLLLYDGRHYAEALECYQRAVELTTDVDYRFLALAWQGQILDLMGLREAAVKAYQAALATGSSYVFQYDQYKLKIDPAWVRERLQTQFKRD